MTSKHEEALVLAEELLSDIELERVNYVSIARKASRLARLLDDVSSMVWLGYEVTGYPQGVSGLDRLAWSAAQKTGRVYTKDSKQLANTIALGQLQAEIDAGKLQFTATTDASYQISSANQYQHIAVPKGNSLERNLLRSTISSNQALLDRIMGAIHIYVSRTYQELRFGAAVESAFQNVRQTVDTQINQLIPNALPILTTALENAQTDNQVQWNNAAKGSRDLIKAAADTLRPPSEPKNGIEMTDDKYINRLVDWIQTNIESSSKKELLKSELTHLGERLDAVTSGGHKGAHADVSKQDASRYIVGTYLLLGDILQLAQVSNAASKEVASEEQELGDKRANKVQVPKAKLLKKPKSKSG